MKLLLILVCIASFSHAATKPNVIHIIADDLGYGDLSAYGKTHFTTPNIDAIAKKGITFKHHYFAAPVCAPARGALMTGCHAGHGAVRGNFEVMPEGRQAMPADTFTLAHLFKKAGYATGAFGKQREMLWGNFGMETQEDAPDSIQAQALKFVEANKDRPFFLYYPMIQPHAEMFAPEKTMDEDVGELMAKLEELGIADNTLVIFTSDNGPQRQHDYLYREFHEKKGRVAIRKGNWKGVRYDVPVNPKSPLELYDLSKDPGETKNIAERNEGVVRELDLLIAGARTVSPVEKFNFPTDYPADQ